MNLFPTGFDGVAEVVTVLQASVVLAVAFAVVVVVFGVPPSLVGRLTLGFTLAWAHFQVYSTVRPGVYRVRGREVP